MILKQKRLLMLTATMHEVPFILAAKKMGFYVITTNNRPDYPGHKYADEYVFADFSQYDYMVELCKKLQIDAISWGCSDPCALAACYIGEKLGLKGHDTYENGQIIHLKDKFKEFAAKINLKTPKSVQFVDMEKAFEFEGTLPYPLIIKPVDLAGGKGIHVVNNSVEYKQAIECAFASSYVKRIVVEQYITGTLHSLNTFIVDQKVVAYCSANDYSYQNPYMTNSGVAPADNWEHAVDVLIPETEKVAQTLKLVDGQLHMQYIMHDGEPYIIEMMRRNIGNFWSSMINDSIGVNWPEWVIRAEAGMDCHNIPKKHLPNGYYGYHMLLAGKNGIFKDVVIDPSIEKHIYQTVMWEQPGFDIQNHIYDKLGNMLVRFDTEQEKDYFMPRINELIKVIVE